MKWSILINQRVNEIERKKNRFSKSLQTLSDFSKLIKYNFFI